MKTLRPGISASFLERAEIQQLSSAEAVRRCGLNQSGIWIPYRAWDGCRLKSEDGLEIGRLVLEQPGQDVVFHCTADSRGRAFLPPGINEVKPGGDLFICDTEFCALSLAETGVAAVGLQGFWGFIGADGTVAPELVDAISHLAPRRVMLVGNSGSSLDPEYAKAAVGLRAKLGIPILSLVRIPLDMPAGVDAVRESLKERFPEQWANWIDESVPVVPGSKAPDVAVDLITREAIDNLEDQRRHEVEEMLVKLADAIEDAPLAQGRLIAFAVGDLRIAQFRRAIKQCRDQRLLTAKNPTASPLPEPWPEPVDGGALLRQIQAFIRRFMSMSDDAVKVCAVWALHTWVSEAFDFTPLLHVDSPEKGCGKTTLRHVLAEIAANPQSTSGTTEASVFRRVNRQKVTLLVDEWDVMSAKDRGMLTKILNAGVEPDGTIDRVVGADVETFNVFGPKAIFGIQGIGLPESTASRTIRITLHRPLPEESKRLEQFKARLVDNDLLRRMCVRWAVDNRSLLETANPILPPWMRDRKAQVWSPLLAIADLAGHSWSNDIRVAAKELSGRTATTHRPAHLAIIDALTILERKGVDRMFSADLVEEMIRLAGDLNKQADDNHRPWKDGFKGGTALTPIRLGDLLRAYDVEPQSIRQPQNPQTRKGYYKEALLRAHQRYIGPVHPTQNGTTAQNE